MRRRHPWVLSGAVARVEGPEESPGALVRVVGDTGEVLGHGFHSPRSALRVRLVAFGKEAPPEDWLARRIAAAVDRRARDPQLDRTDAFRLVNAEGDGLPGLVADRYADTVVVKLTSAGMAAHRERVGAALRAASGAAHGLERADAVAARREGVPAQQGALWGEPPTEPVLVCENGRRLRVDTGAGQKTGGYLDQRDARDLVQRLARDARVLDLFAYSGGFALAAATGEARELTLVESSTPALALAREHVPGARVVEGDAFRFVRSDSGEYDLVVADPPPLARGKRDVTRASRAYKDLLLHALRRTAPGGRVLAFACSHHVGPDLFRKVAFAAALDAGRDVAIAASLAQPSDHPVSLYHPEGAYLTGLLLQA